MGKYILHHDGVYAIWSTVVDAPITEPFDIVGLMRYIRLEHGIEGLLDLADRLERAHARGCSAEDGSTLDELIAEFRRSNRGDAKELRCLSRRGFIQVFLTLPGHSADDSKMVGEVERGAAMTRYCWTDTQYEWTGSTSHPSREDALAEGRAHSPGRTIWTAKQQTLADWLEDDARFTRGLGEMVVEHVDMNFGEASGADDVVVDATNEQHMTIGRAIVAAIKDHTICTRFVVVDVQQHEPEVVA